MNAITKFTIAGCLLGVFGFLKPVHAEGEPRLTPPYFTFSYKEALSLHISRFLAKQDELAYTVDVFTEEEITNSGARHLYEFLSQVPGFRWINTNYGERGLWIRNFFSKQQERILLLVDGHPISFASFEAVLSGRLLPLYNIRRIEIIRGPASQLYGADALNGVVNILTKSPTGLNAVELSASHESFNTQEYSLSVGTLLGPASILANIGHYRTESTETIRHREEQMDTSRDIDLFAKFQTSRLSGSMHYIRGNASSPGVYEGRLPDEFSENFATFDNRIHLNVFSAHLNYESEKQDDTPQQWKIASYVNSHKLRLRSEYAIPDTEILVHPVYEAPETTANIEAHYLRKSCFNITDASLDAIKERGMTEDDAKKLRALTGKTHCSEDAFLQDVKKILGRELVSRHRDALLQTAATTRNQFMAGIAGKYQQISLDGEHFDNDGKLFTTFSFSAFLQDYFHVTESLTFTTELRYDYDREFHSAFSPGLGAIYTLGEKNRLRAYYSESFRLPTVLERFGGGIYVITTFHTIDNPSLEAEEFRSFEIGLEHDFFERDAAGMKGHVRIFRNWREQPIYIDIYRAMDTEEEIQFINAPDTYEAEGVEVSLRNYYRWFCGEVNYVYSNFSEPDVYAKHKVNFILTADVAHRFITTVKGALRARNEFFYPFRASSLGMEDDFFQLDVSSRLQVFLKNLWFSANVYNLLDSQFAEKSGIPQPKRSFAAKLEYTHHF